MNIQLTAPSGVVYSYFLEPDEQAVLPFSEAPVSISSPAISRLMETSMPPFTRKRSQ